MILAKLQGGVFSFLLCILVYTHTTTASFSASLENHCDLVLAENLAQEIKVFTHRLNSVGLRAGN